MRAALWVGLCGLVALVPATPALAYWQAGGAGSGSALTATLPSANEPTATASGGSVTVTWTQSSFHNRLLGSYQGGGYTVKRYAQGSSSAVTPNAGCSTRISGTESALECVEAGVPAGDWQYSTRPVLNSFSGEESPRSAAVTVDAPELDFSSSTTITGLPTTLSGNISNFAAGQAVTFRLDDAATGDELSGSISPSAVPESGSAPVSVTVPVGTSDGTHAVHAVGDQGDTASATVAVQALDRFEIDPVGEQDSGKSFAVTVRASDAKGQTISAYNGTGAVSTNSGRLEPTTTDNFVDGVLAAQRLTLTGDYNTDQTITVAAGSPAKTGTSNPFTLRDWKFYFKKTDANSGANCAAASRQRDMEEGYAGADPEETSLALTSTNTLRFCSRAFSAGAKLPAGTTTLRGWGSNLDAILSCNVTATVYRNGTDVLGSAVQSIPRGTGTIGATTWQLSTPALTFADGDRLSVVLSGQTAQCALAKFHYGGTARRSQLELPTQAAGVESTGPGALEARPGEREQSGRGRRGSAASSVKPGPLRGGGYVGTGSSTPKLVRFIQLRVSGNGFRTRVDGVFGPRTEAAVRRFQAARRLLVDGIVGRQTMAALRDSAVTLRPR